MDVKEERADIPGSQGRLGKLRQQANETAQQSKKHGMSEEESLKFLQGLESAVPKHAQSQVVVVVRRRSADSDLPALAQFSGVGTLDRHYFTREDYASKYGSDPADIERIVEFAKQHDLAVVDDEGNDVTDLDNNTDFIKNCASRRMLMIAGPQKSLDNAFGVETKIAYHEGDLHRVHAEPVSVPLALANTVQWVYGLETEPVTVASPHMAAITASEHELGKSNIMALTCHQLASLYKFPAKLNGAGECIGILEPYGGYFEKDLDIYFKFLNMPKPNIVAMGCNDAEWYEQKGLSMNNIEVALDVQIASALAPGATTAVYLPAKCSSTIDGFPKRLYEILSKAIYDDINRPSILSLSWGGAETTWKAGDRLQLDELLRDAVCLGITVCMSSGDSGVSPPSPKAGIQAPPVTVYPASNPHVLSCGGTSLEAYDSSTNTFDRETVWNDHAITLLVGSNAPGSEHEPIINQNGAGASGGGVSNCYEVPEFQKHADVPVKTILNWTGGEVRNEPSVSGRGVPDVAANADLHTGYKIRFMGKLALGGGSSAAAPLWAGLVARINEGLGRRVGFLNPELYELQLRKKLGVCNEITEGNNGGYDARSGWDACTGLGSPNGEALLSALAHNEPE